MSLDGTPKRVFAVTDTSPSTAVVEAVADAEGVDPLDLSPLYESIDPDALDALFRNRSAATVEFEYEGYAVEVRESAEIVLRG